MTVTLEKSISFKRVVKKYHAQNVSCQGLARSVDLQALDSNKWYIFYERVSEKVLFYRPLKETYDCNYFSEFIFFIQKGELT